ncbi:hypothetical protein P170DRAFT_460945 [Aspergillus steynii IBT 23096]|uniref:Uncharacterized protein n=1 Tax=Aspergillus steynii IBT 23096 TaxID=1392250 RepID=A0A2I2GQ19_9EURO|nr:uncharacterized protein P170DRAFT_460945 [Aspergillus steynii IBT 23096]PLB54977.1 hypothetical protein P170DRAFT_460945 [Aspergillus steynii IBT 23096]
MVNVTTLCVTCHEATSSRFFRQSQNAVEAIYDQLEHNDWQGNQWLVNLGLSQDVIDRLSNDPSCLSDIAFRFTWIGTKGLIKVVVPSIQHNFTTSGLVHYIDQQCILMGVPDNDLAWGRTVTTPGTDTTHGKQPDGCFYPPNRQPLGGQFNGWPSMVIETGVSESLAKLRCEATWWFEKSSGDTRTVILISIKAATKEIRFEKWQLISPNVPRPVTKTLEVMEDYVKRLTQGKDHYMDMLREWRIRRRRWELDYVKRYKDMDAAGWWDRQGPVSDEEIENLENQINAKNLRDRY